MIPFYLVLSHFIADFVLQPQSLIRYKEKSFLGVFSHCLIHVIVSVLLLLPFLNSPSVWLAIFTIAITHIIIDQGKIFLQGRTDRYFYPFLIDQVLHLLVIFAVFFGFGLHFDITLSFAPEWLFSLYTNIYLLILIQIFILFTIVYDMAVFQLQRERDKKTSFHINTKNLGLRLIAAALIFLLLIYLI